MSDAVEVRMKALRAKVDAKRLLNSLPAPAGNKRKLEVVALQDGAANSFASPGPVPGSASGSSGAAPEQPTPAGEKEGPPVEEGSGSPSQLQAEVAAVRPPQGESSSGTLPIHSVKDDLIFKLTDELPLKIMDGTTKQGRWASVRSLLVGMDLADWPEDSSPPLRTLCVHYLFQLRGSAHLVWLDKEKKFTVTEFAPSRLNPPTPWSVTYVGNVSPPTPEYVDDAVPSNESGDVASSVPVPQTTA